MEIKTLSNMYHMRELWGKVLIAQNDLGNGYTTKALQLYYLWNTGSF